jgi:hypothetical protein
MAHKKALLLNASYEVITFIPERKIFKLLFKDKCEVIETWQDTINWGNGSILLPSVLRLKSHIRRNYFNSNFSRKALVKRDRSSCQYCGKKLSASQITIDHVLPRAQGGITSFTNCVVACQICNNKKADKTPEQAHMMLLRKPTHPSFNAANYVSDPQEHWHPSWDDFLGTI